MYFTTANLITSEFILNTLVYLNKWTRIGFNSVFEELDVLT